MTTITRETNARPTAKRERIKHAFGTLNVNEAQVYTCSSDRASRFMLYQKLSSSVYRFNILSAPKHLWLENIPSGYRVLRVK